MNNSNSTDAGKSTGQQTPPAKKVEGANESQPVKAEDPGTDTDRQVAGDSKQSTDDAGGKSLR
ncbi:hypothetical protein [Noviluteimonas dokdonensis]|uniref:hypothetical protein n=1 Tax=Noviluteimonas dokdonensis TaxID=414050 RepID=UPI00055A4BDF|nr:hypothetical protein [Lysobacter dokdonensis]